MSAESKTRFDICVERISKIFDEERARKICMKQFNPLSDEEIKRICEYALNIMRNEPDRYHVIYEAPSGMKVDVIFVTTPNNPIIKVTKSGNFKVGVLMPTPGPITWVTAFLFTHEQAELLVNNPGSPFLLVGKLRKREREGSPTYSMNVFNVIPLFERAGDIIDVENVREDSREESGGVEVDEETRLQRYRGHR